MERIAKVGLPFALASGSALRLTRLGFQSEWNDEALSATIAGGSLRQILSNEFHSLHPPGYYVLLHFWRGILGDSEFALRLLSALLGILGIAVVYLLGRSLFGRACGTWAAAITAFMPFHLFYSQETRMYSLLFLLSASAMLIMSLNVRRKRSPELGWLLYLLVSLAGLYTHYLFGLALLALALYVVAVRRHDFEKKFWRWFLLTHLAMGLLYAPIIVWIRDQWNQSADYWISDASLAGFLSLPLSFTVGHFLDGSLVLAGYALILSLILISILQAMRALLSEGGTKNALIMTVLVYWLPVCALFAISSLWTPLTLPRLMMVAVPGLYIWLAWGATLTREKWVNGTLLVLLIGVGMVANYNWLFDPRFQKPPAREAARYLQNTAASEEPVVFANDSGFRLFTRYAPSLDHRLLLDEEENDNAQVRPDVIRLMGGEIFDPHVPLLGTFWLVLHQDFEVEEQEQIYRAFEAQYVQLSAQDFGGIRIYHYQDAGR